MYELPCFLPFRLTPNAALRESGCGLRAAPCALVLLAWALRPSAACLPRPPWMRPAHTVGVMPVLHMPADAEFGAHDRCSSCRPFRAADFRTHASRSSSSRFTTSATVSRGCCLSASRRGLSVDSMRTVIVAMWLMLHP